MRWRDAMILRLAAAWTALVWLVFIRNIASDYLSFWFKFLHIALAIFSVCFAVLIWQVAHRARHGDES